MKTARRNKAGFTLIELMVVVLVIAILARMVFRLVSNVGTSSAEANTRATLEKVGLALEAFRNVYGKYPPVPYYEGYQPVAFEMPSSVTMHASENGLADGNNLDDLINYEKNRGKIGWGSGKNKGKLFTFGLVSFFMPRYMIASQDPVNVPLMGAEISSSGGGKHGTGVSQWEVYNQKDDTDMVGDSVRDINAARRILPYLGMKLAPNDKGQWSVVNAGDGVIYSPDIKDCHRTVHTDTTGELDVYAQIYSIRDAWYHDLVYSSRPPYETYTLRSAGPDGVTVGSKRGDKNHPVVQEGDPETRDDIVIGQAQ